MYPSNIGDRNDSIFRSKKNDLSKEHGIHRQEMTEINETKAKPSLSFQLLIQ